MWWRRREQPAERISPAVMDAALRVQIREHVPVRPALAQQHPELTGAELDQCVAIAESAHRHLGELFDSVSKRPGKRPDFEDFFQSARADIPWLSERNASGFFSQCVHSLLK